MVSFRSLTEEEEERLLTQEEVNELEEGTEVMVKWSGGNGPHRYEIERHPKLEHPVIDWSGPGKAAFLDSVTDDPDSGLTKVFLPV